MAPARKTREQLLCFEFESKDSVPILCCGGGDTSDRAARLHLANVLPRALQSNKSLNQSSSRALPEETQNRVRLLPVKIIRDGRLKQYIWAGRRLKAVDVERLGQDSVQTNSLRFLVQNVKHLLSEAFFPKKDEVTVDYWNFVSWRAGHRLASAMLNNFATQSLLAAVGVGARNQLPAAASINWLLKDGLGRLGRLSVAASLGNMFDSDLKRYRWITSLVYTSSTALEFLAPLMPQHFLLLASVANVGKSVGVTTYVATHPAFMRSFATGENLADVNAKGQAQQMVMDTLGLGLCVALTYSVRRSQRGRLLLPLCAFPFLAFADLFCIYRELKATHLRSLNQERAELLAQHWLARGAILPPSEVSVKERLVLPTQAGNGVLPLKFVPLEDSVSNPDELQELLQESRGQRYLFNSRQQGQRVAGKEHIAVTLQEGALPTDILTAILHASVLRHLQCQSQNPDQALKQGSAPSRNKDAKPGNLWSREDDLAKSIPGNPQLLRLESESAELAKRLAPAFAAALEQGGWQTRPVLVPAHQRNGVILQH